MVPYGMFVMTTWSKDKQEVGTATITWLTQCSFQPPLIAVGVRKDSTVHRHLIERGAFAINVIGKDQIELARQFFKPCPLEGNKIGGYPFEPGPATGSPLILDCPAWWENRVVDKCDKGDHTLFVAEVVEAGVRREDKVILCRDHNLYYAG